MKTFSNGFPSEKGLHHPYDDLFESISWSKRSSSLLSRPFRMEFLSAKGLHRTYDDLFESISWSKRSHCSYDDLFESISWSKRSSSLLSRPFRMEFLAQKVFITHMKTFSSRFPSANGLHHPFQDLFEQIS